MNTQDKSDAGYQSYMIRMWRKWDSQGKPMWCASLQEPGSRHTESFENANALFAYLRRQLGMEEPTEHPPPQPQREQPARWEQQVQRG